MQDFQGIFRSARGSSTTFIDVYEYEGVETFPSEFVFVFDTNRGIGLQMFPLFVRGLDKHRPHFVEPDYFMYDIARAGSRDIGYRAVQERGEVALSAQGPLGELYQATASLLKSDPKIELIRGIRLNARSSD